MKTRRRLIILLVLGVFLAAGLYVVSEASAQQAPSDVTVSGIVTADAPDYFEFVMFRVKQLVNEEDEPWDGAEVSLNAINFGTLDKVLDDDSNFCYMKGQYYYCALMMACTSGRPYEIQQSGTQFTSGSYTLPYNSVLLVPDYQYNDKFLYGGGTLVEQGAMPTGASLGAPTSACRNAASPAVVYSSGAEGAGSEGRIIRAFLAIGGPKQGQTEIFNHDRGYDGETPVGTNQGYEPYAAGGETDWTPITPDQHAGQYTSSIIFTLTAQ